MKHKLQMLVAALMLCATPLFAHDFEVDGIYYNFTSAEDKTVEVTYSGDSYYAVENEYSGSVTIPETVTYNDNTYSVTNIGERAFISCSSLTSVVIGNSVTSIGDLAFAYCSSLTSVVIPNSMTSIGDGAFYYCSGLTSVVIPNSVTSIGNAIFWACSSLTSVEIPNSVTSIGISAFYGCSSLTSVEIPNSVTSIGDDAFHGCSSLTSVEIPNSVTSIGEAAFFNIPLRTIISKVINPTSQSANIFNNYTYIHAPLYVPEGVYWNYAYKTGWGDFVHIKEMAMTEEALLSNKAYMIANSQGTNYKVYDAEKDLLKTVEYTHALDEVNKDCCWTVIKENGMTYLYNLGAKKFGIVGENGAISLSETPVHLTISETENGLSINGYNYMFVLNKHVKVDVTGISEVILKGTTEKKSPIYSLDGRSQQTLKRGINIVNGIKIFVK